jgi:hypothetical protein
VAKPSFRVRLYRIGQAIEWGLWQPLARFFHVVHPAPLAAGLAAAWLLAEAGQLSESYLIVADALLIEGSVRQLAWAIASLCLLSAALYYCNYSLSNVEIDWVWRAERDTVSDRWQRGLRNGVGLMCAWLPWLGLAGGIWLTRQDAMRSLASLQPLGPDFAPRELEHQLGAVVDWGITAALLAVLSGSAFALALAAVRRNRAVRWSTLILIALLFIGSAGFEYFLQWAGVSRASLVELPRFPGPLAVIVLTLVLLFAILAVLILLSRHVRFPVIALTLLAVVVLIAQGLSVTAVAAIAAGVFLVVSILAALSKRWRLVGLSLTLFALSVPSLLPPSYPAAAPAPAGAAASLPVGLDAAFRSWLDARALDIADRANREPGRRYPVFIVAAQGGGIYAAAASALFLAQMEDRCPGFSRHVFAVSGVSGGAVGSAVFASLLSDRPAGSVACTGRTDRLEQQARNVVDQDHLSPLLGLVVSDLLNLRSDRGVGLERSFEHALGAVADGSAHRRLFDWQPAGSIPALVLNTTWAETGFRVAFAPVGLAAASPTLLSFLDAPMGGGHGLEHVTVIRAAIASARFPGVLPAFVYGRNAWNFVDGGYADGSGAATALDIYQAIAGQAAQRGVDLRVILLTSVEPQVDLAEVSGKPVRDTLAPIQTLLSVRGLLTEQAVARIEAALASRGSAADWRIRRIALDPESFGLSLGWTISRPKLDIISLQLGRPDRCRAYHGDRGTDGRRNSLSVSEQTIYANSCAKRDIERALMDR